MADRRKKNKPMTLEDVQTVMSNIIYMVALLHAHEMCHLDIKPENIMRTKEGDWKLIDVDGAVKTAQKIPLNDTNIAFTPVYCAPEFAQVTPLPLGNALQLKPA